MKRKRDWNDLIRRHKAFWGCHDIDRPLVVLTHQYYVDPKLLASLVKESELKPHLVDPYPILAEYDKIAAAHELIGDDMVASGEPLLGVPWLEAICGCPIKIIDGEGIWPEPPINRGVITNICFSEDNPWFQKLLEVTQIVVNHVKDRYAVSPSHLRGITDILVALFGSERFFLNMIDEPELISDLANQAAQVWTSVADAQCRIIPSYRNGYAIRQFGLWAPARIIWLQDDTSGMMSLDHYRQFFLDPLKSISVFPYGVLHLHIPSLHLVEAMSSVANIRAINLYLDDTQTDLREVLPALRAIQEKKIPLILCKDVSEGFTLEEYRVIMEELSPRGLSLHLKAGSIEEGQAVMAKIDEGRKMGLL